MGHHDEDHTPDELQDVARRLRAHRTEASPLELDRIKLRAMASAKTSRPKGSALKSRLIVALAAVGLMAGGTSGVIAAKGGNGNGGSAAESQYRPGKGCGDNNHAHAGAPGQEGKKNEGKACPATAGPKK